MAIARPADDRASSAADARTDASLESLDASLESLGRRLRGRLVRPGDEDYDASRQVWHGGVDRHPAAVVRAADEADVVRAVSFARDHRLPLAVRGGGHSMAGHGTVDDGVVIDMSGMRGLAIDPVNRLAWAQAGLTAGEYTTRAHEHGLATPFGDTASVGIAGLTLGGGIGYLVRRHGLTIDSLRAVELVTADGRLVTASEDQNADLFWAVRGGGGNFGVVTSFQYELHPIDTVYGGALLLPATAEVLSGYAAAAAAAPDALSTIASIMHLPAAPFVPADLQGRLGFVMLAIHSGDVADGERVFAPFRSLATPIADLLGPMPYPAIYRFTAEASNRHEGVVRTTYLRAIDERVVAATLDFMGRASSPMAMAQFRVLGGAMARVAPGATAFAHRDKAALLTIITPFLDPAEADRHRTWTTAFLAALGPSADGAYVNFLEAEGEARIHAAYPGATYERLASVKKAWDPDNLFRLNQNIEPAR